MHIGTILREQLRREGKSVVWFANELGCHRTNVYNLFEKHSIDTAMLERISVILNCDFFELYYKETQEKIVRNTPPERSVANVATCIFLHYA